MDTQTLIRTLVLALALINQLLVAVGMSPLPIEEAQLETLLSTGATVFAALGAYWKNNSITAAAKAGDTVKDAVKAGNLSAEEVTELVAASK